MCTALTYHTNDHYFGRNLDLDEQYHETVTVTPRRYPFRFRQMGEIPQHYALIGMATVAEGYPLYYDATNEAGLSMAGLNFPDNAVYLPSRHGADNIAPFEFIPWILSQCATVDEAEPLLSRLCLADIPFSAQFPQTPLHWMLADRRRALVIEPMADGVRVMANPVGVLTNNPPFETQAFLLNNYMHLTNEPPQNRFSDKLELTAYSRGMGAMGLPGDLSSASRFVRAAFARLHAVSGDSEGESVRQFFHLLGFVEQPRGCVLTDRGEYEITVYSSCCNVDKGIYYYKTYDNSRIAGVDMHRTNLDGNTPYTFPLLKEDLYIQNI